MSRLLQVVCLAITCLLFLQYIFFHKQADPAPEHIALQTDEHLLKMLNQYSTYLGELLWPALTQYTKLVSQLKTTGLFMEAASEAEVISTVHEIVDTLTHLQDTIALALNLDGPEGDKSDVIMSSSDDVIMSSSDDVIMSSSDDDVIMSPSDDVIMPFRVKEPPKNGSCPDTDTFLVEMERRRKLLNNHCKEESSVVRSKISTLHKSIYFKKSQLSYCPVFKSASSNILAHFCFDYFKAETCRDRSQNGFPLYDRQSSFKMPGNQAWKRFVVVRDPLKRLLSAYRDKIEYFRKPPLKPLLKEIMLNHRRVLWTKYPIKKEQRSKLCDVALGHATKINANEDVQLSDSNPYDHPPYPTFTEFVSAVLMGTQNSHWNPYTQSCGPCGPDKLDFILRSEQLECELHNMLNGTKNSALIQTYQESWATNSAPPTVPSLFYRYYSTLTDDQLEGIWEYYRLDCEFYEYDCVEELARIKVFKLANPGYKDFYSESWQPSFRW